VNMKRMACRYCGAALMPGDLLTNGNITRCPYCHSANPIDLNGFDQSEIYCLVWLGIDNEQPEITYQDLSCLKLYVSYLVFAALLFMGRMLDLLVNLQRGQPIFPYTIIACIVAIWSFLKIMSEK
jgi:DNA-directed RNA polymerase subunit RPC12/RpoP